METKYTLKPSMGGGYLVKVNNSSFHMSKYNG